MVTDADIIRDKAFIELVKEIKQINIHLKNISDELHTMNDIKLHG